MLLDVSPVPQQQLQKCIDKKFSWKVDEYQLLLVRTCSPASCRAGVGGGMWPRVVKLRITLRTHSPVCMITNKFCSPRPLHHVPPCTGSNSRNAFQHEGMWLVAKGVKSPLSFEMCGCFPRGSSDSLTKEKEVLHCAVACKCCYISTLCYIVQLLLANVANVSTFSSYFHTRQKTKTLLE